ncbi:hypothetical protein BHE74_00029683 [Ensete ventricosum]|nr:hypothetical protein GW17_00045848 [Ensete ventricosum]RWW63156.1 hypothetical protein BHE74_00029683 [Ensete ventricosum]
MLKSQCIHPTLTEKIALTASVSKIHMHWPNSRTPVAHHSQGDTSPSQSTNKWGRRGLTRRGCGGHESRGRTWIGWRKHRCRLLQQSSTFCFFFVQKQCKEKKKKKKKDE